jgi:hypothetical protein
MVTNPADMMSQYKFIRKEPDGSSCGLLIIILVDSSHCGVSVWKGKFRWQAVSEEKGINESDSDPMQECIITEQEIHII